MMNFKNSKTAKVVSGFVGLATVLLMVGPSVASAMTNAEIMAAIAQLQAQMTPGDSSSSAMSCSYTFTKGLKMGMSDSEVMNLQKVLNMSADTQVAASGVGSMGNETMYFGGKTKAAVIKFQNKYASDILTPAGLTMGTGFVGAGSRAKLNMLCMPSQTPTPSPTTPVDPVTGTPVVSGSGVSVSLDTTSPMSHTLISPQGVATLAVFKISNGGSAPAKVTMIKMQRKGVSSDSTLNNVYLYDAMGNRITDAASVSTGMISFSDSSGIVTVPAMGSISVAVRADVASSMNGQTISVMLTEVTADGVAAAGTPVSGSEDTIATAPSGITTADFTGTTVPTTGAIDAQNDFTVWQRTLSIGSRDAMLSAIRFQQIGSAYIDDVANFRLMVDGVAVGTAVAKADAGRFVTFNFATPVTVKAGSHVVKLVADVVGGSGRNFQFSLRRVVDVELWDSQLNIVVTPTVSNTTFAAIDAGLMSVNAGTITITKSTDSPSGNVVINGSAITLGKFTVRAAGEKLKVENLRVSHTASDANWHGIRNGALFLNGAQIGSTATICEDTVNASCSVAYTQFNLGSSMVLEPGKDYTLEVRGDVFNTNTAYGTLVAGTSTTVNIAAGSSNVYRMTSLGYISNTLTASNQITAAAGSLVLSKYGAYAGQTVTVPQTALKIGEFRLSSGATEGVNLDTITVAINTSVAANLSSNYITNLYVVYGGKTSQIKSTGAASQSWSINEALAVNTNMPVAVYATLNSAFTGAASTTLTVSGTSQSSGSAVASSAVVGQDITQGSGTITAAADASTPVAALAVGGTMPKVGSFKFTTTNDTFTIDELTVHMNSGLAADAAAISELVFKDGATELKRQSMNGVNATATGLSIPIAVNGTKVIDVYANLGNVGTGFANTGANIGLALESYEYLNSNGVKTRNFGVASTSNNMYVYKTKPTITNVALPTTVLTGGTQTIYKFTITADAGGTIAWQKINFNVATSGSAGAPALTSTSWTLYDASNETSALPNVTVTANAAGTVVTASSTVGVDQEVSGSKTYTLKASVVGTLTTGMSVSTSIASGGVAHAAPTSAGAVATAGSTNFIWSDEAITPHTAGTADWNNDNLVKNLPTDSLTLTK